MISHLTRSHKIKGIIAANIHNGEQFAADKINKGHFPPPGHASKWLPEHIKPMMAGEISLKPVPKKTMVYISSTIDQKSYDIVFRNAVTNSAFIRAAVNEKILREGLE